MHRRSGFPGEDEGLRFPAPRRIIWGLAAWRFTPEDADGSAIKSFGALVSLESSCRAGTSGRMEIPLCMGGSAGDRKTSGGAALSFCRLVGRRRGTDVSFRISLRGAELRLVSHPDIVLAEENH